MTFHSVGNAIIPTDEVIFFRGVAKNHQPVLKLNAELTFSDRGGPCAGDSRRWQ